MTGSAMILAGDKSGDPSVLDTTFMESPGYLHHEADSRRSQMHQEVNSRFFFDNSIPAWNGRQLLSGWRGSLESGWEDEELHLLRTVTIGVSSVSWMRQPQISNMTDHEHEFSRQNLDVR